MLRKAFVLCVMALCLPQFSSAASPDEIIAFINKNTNLSNCNGLYRAELERFLHGNENMQWNIQAGRIRESKVENGQVTLLYGQSSDTVLMSLSLWEDGSQCYANIVSVLYFEEPCLKSKGDAFNKHDATVGKSHWFKNEGGVDGVFRETTNGCQVTYIRTVAFPR